MKGNGMTKLSVSIICPIATLAIFAFWLTYSGPYRWLAEWQLSSGGRYDEKLTLIGTLVVCYLCAVLVIKLTAIALAEPMPDLSDPAFGRMVNGIFLCGAVGAIAVGSWMWWSAKNMTEPEIITVADLVSRRASLSRFTHRYVRIPHGRLVFTAAKGVSEGTSGSTPGMAEYYVPLIEPGASVTAGPVQAFVEMNQYEVKDILSKGMTDAPCGIVALNTLPGMVRVSFEKTGMNVAPMPLVIDYKSTADTAAFAGIATAGVGLIVGLIFLSKRGSNKS
jgi:hypothetical protein